MRSHREVSRSQRERAMDCTSPAMGVEPRGAWHGVALTPAAQQKEMRMNRFFRSTVAAAVSAGAAVAALISAVAPQPLNFYQQGNLVSDGFVRAEHTDRNLVNAWGLQFNPT